MEREFFYYKTFEKHWKELGLKDNDLIALEQSIMDNPQIGAVIQDTGGLRKMRCALPNAGKSGGARVLYVDFASFEKTALMNVYPKSQKANITSGEKQELKKIIEELSKELRK